MPLSWKWCLVLAFLGVVLWTHSGMAAKIDRFTDKEGTLHISNAGEAEPGKPSGAPPAVPIGTLPPQQIFPPAAPVPPPPATVMPSPVEPPEMSGDEGEPQAEPPAQEGNGETMGKVQPAPGAHPAQVPPQQIINNMVPPKRRGAVGAQPQ